MSSNSLMLLRRAVDRVRVAWQYVVPQHWISRFMYWFTRIEYAPVKNRFIDWFIARFDIDMSQALEPDPHAYPTFNAFFTRALKPDARPVAAGADAIACPVDGTVSQIGNIVENRLFQAKGRYFSLETLLGGSRESANAFRNGRFTTIYLAPRDYHRIHMPVDGTLTRMIHIPGRLFSVNPRTTRTVRNLFARNERVVCLFDSAAGPMAVILVGAINVSSIETVWAGTVTGHHSGPKIREWNYRDKPLHLKRGAELGRFNMGSTVILLFGPDAVEWEPSLGPETVVNMGQLLGNRRRRAADA